MAENIRIALTKNETLTLATERTYAESNIEVTAALEERSVVANGTYTPGADKVAISSITVNRPADVPTLQDKSITIDGNKPKTVSVVADEGYDALGNVTVITNIQPELEERTVTPTKAQQTIEPPEGKDGFSKVTINAIPAQYIKTADATATAGDMLEGETGYVNSVKVVGTIKTYTGGIVTGWRVLVSSDVYDTLDGWNTQSYMYWSSDDGSTWNQITTTVGETISNVELGKFSQIKFKVEKGPNGPANIYIKSATLGMSVGGGYGTQLSDNYTLTQDITDVIISDKA